MNEGIHFIAAFYLSRPIPAVDDVNWRTFCVEIGRKGGRNIWDSHQVLENLIDGYLCESLCFHLKFPLRIISGIRRFQPGMKWVWKCKRNARGDCKSVDRTFAFKMTLQLSALELKFTRVLWGLAGNLFELGEGRNLCQWTWSNFFRVGNVFCSEQKKSSHTFFHFFSLRFRNN